MKVSIWKEQVIIPTYQAGVPDKNPMFFENRVYQGSSGVVYPNPVIESISDEKVDQEYSALFLENEYLKIMILPELGGRVQMAYDKIANRYFIYYNQVIKPALVGLCGPWISGGIEFNWPQHHRPSTFDPVDFSIEEHADGSKTVWVNEVEKMFHTRGMAGFTIYPDKAYLEIKAKLYNRTNLPQTFLWWANPAVSVNDHYQSVFPPDVNAVFDHGKRDVSDFPIATGTYYKIDYSPGTDISRYKNIPVPTSYMAVNSEYNFVGGYEHDTRAGVLHVADHHVSPGKKQWTWGNGDFGVAWDRNLTDEDGPYIELMTGVYTDNQPDFSWIMPYEEKTFTQYFMPYRELGMVKNASKDLLVSLEKTTAGLTLKIFATGNQRDLQVILKAAGQIILDQKTNLSPKEVFIKEIPLTGDVNEQSLLLLLLDPSGVELLRYEPASNKKNEIPEPAKPALAPRDIESTEQLFLTGQHLEQYRHATYSPVPYYEEALRRDPNDIRNNNALGAWYLRRGQFAKSEPYFSRAVATSIQRNPNPYDGEPYYNLALAQRYQNKIDEAYNSFFKATWNSAWQDGAYFSIAQIDMMRGHYERALEHISWSLDRNARNSRAWHIKVHALRKLGRISEALEEAGTALKRDQFNLSVLAEQRYCFIELKDEKRAAEVLDQLIALSRGTAHNLRSYALDYAATGSYQQAIDLLLLNEAEGFTDPLLNYYISYYAFLLGDKTLAKNWLQRAATADPGYCFPNRLEDILVLNYAISENPADARAPYFLGNLWYDKRQYTDAVKCWEKSAALDNTFSTVFRNLAIAAFNKQNDPERALQLFEKAFQLNPNDARVLMELDQLYKRLNRSPESRLAFLNKNRAVVLRRDDLYLETVALLNFTGNIEQGYEQLSVRKFHPWEGGEGKVSAQYLFSLVELAKEDLKNRLFEAAIQKLEQAQIYPHSLGEGKLPGAQENDVFYWLGCAYNGLDDSEKAGQYWEKATVGLSEPSAAMFYNDQQPDKIFYQGLAWQRLKNTALATRIFEKLVQYGNANLNEEVRIDYFAVSLPDLLIFEDDLNRRNHIHCLYIAGLGHLGLQQYQEAEAKLAGVLELDSMHFGALTHMRLLEALKETTG